LLKRLQAAGMVTRTRDVNDERRVLVNLTNASRAIEADVRGIDGKIENRPPADRFRAAGCSPQARGTGPPHSTMIAEARVLIEA